MPASGNSPAVEGAYHFSLRRGHTVHLLVHEIYGGFAPGAVALLYELGRKHGARLGADENSAPWCARSFRSLHSMKISVALQMAGAEEIMNAIKDDAAAASE